VRPLFTVQLHSEKRPHIFLLVDKNLWTKFKSGAGLTTKLESRHKLILILLIRMLIICQLVGPLSIANSFSKSNLEIGHNQNLDSNQLRWLLSGHSHEMLYVYSSVVGTISASMNMKAQLILTAIAKPCGPGKGKAEVFSYVTERQARRKCMCTICMCMYVYACMCMYGSLNDHPSIFTQIRVVLYNHHYLTHTTFVIHTLMVIHIHDNIHTCWGNSIKKGSYHIHCVLNVYTMYMLSSLFY
jgi:hypothetical protein